MGSKYVNSAGCMLMMILFDLFIVLVIVAMCAGG